LTYDPVGSKWGELDLAVSAFGDYTRQSVLTWNTLPYATWEAWGWENWNGPENIVGFPFDLASDYSGHTYDLHMAEKDDTANYTGYCVISTDLIMQQMVKRYGNALADYKRLGYAKLFFRRQSAGTLDLSIKRDNEPNWQAAGTVIMTDVAMQREIVEREITGINLRAKHYLLKVGSASKFSLIGIMLGFLPDGRY
jgi:hypothetical protein